jgi:CheY-like chemotaxis protein
VEESMSRPVPATTHTILVVDDEPEVLSVAEDMLKTMGYAVLSTADPRLFDWPALTGTRSICS